MSVPVTAADSNDITLRLDSPEPAKVEQQIPQEEPAGTRVVQPSVPQLSPPPVVGGASAVLMDVDTGRVLYAKNAHARRPNASTTKIMTAILLIEHCKMEDKIRVSKNAANTPYTSLHLKQGETITVKDLLTGMLIRSANDAAVAAAEHIAGNTKRFAVMMNRKAAEIGCRDTHFVTPNGLYDPHHYSSAYDLCLMARYAFRYPIFNEAINTRKYYLLSRSLNKEDMAVYTRSKFLKNYPGADGVKSGYIKQARSCYVGSATRDGWRLVSTVLGSNNSTNDTMALMDYGFNNFESVTVAKANEAVTSEPVKGGGKPSVELVAEHDLKVPVPRTGAKIVTKLELIHAQAPITKGAKLGEVKAIVDGVEMGSVDLKAADDVGVSMARRAMSLIRYCGILVACVMGGRYGTAFAKNTRRRRRRVTSPLRGYSRYR